MSRTTQPVRVLITAMAGLALVLPASAQAATRPAVATGKATKITATTVHLVGTVNPNGAKTTYLFQYGRSSLYGTSTAITVAGSAKHKRPVRVDISGLAPAKTYHYRLVARNAHGVANGSDRTFRTKAQPLALSLVATPNPVRFGRPTVLAGVLTGTGNAERPIQLQASPFPHTAGFVNVGNPQVGNAQGVFAFALLSVALNTQFRVTLPSKPTIVSPIVGVGVIPRVSTRISATTVFSGASVRFSGTIRPARNGTRVVIQRLVGRHWRQVAATKARKGGERFSRYAKRVHIRKGGSYRVHVESADGSYVASEGRSVRIHRR